MFAGRFCLFFSAGGFRSQIQFKSFSFYAVSLLNIIKWIIYLQGLRILIEKYTTVANIQNRVQLKNFLISLTFRRGKIKNMYIWLSFITNQMFNNSKKSIFNIVILWNDFYFRSQNIWKEHNEKEKNSSIFVQRRVLKGPCSEFPVVLVRATCS